VAGLVGNPHRLAQQVFPFVARQAAIFEVGTCPFAAVIEEALVVILGLQRLDFSVDERVKLGQIGE
jgi:hypothetical protein